VSRTSTFVVVTVLVASLTASFFVLAKVQAVFPSNSMEDVLFIGSPEFAKRASLGYSGLLADIYWMRVVQYLGGKHHEDAAEMKALAPLLDIATTLDPNLVIAYEWGSTFLDQPPPVGAGDERAAIALGRKGIKNNPDNWRLYFSLGFIQYLGQHDYLGAAHTLEEASRLPHAPPVLKFVAAKMMTQAGSIETARYMWQSIYNESQDKDIKNNAMLHLDSFAVDEQVPKLESLITRFRQRFGRNPISWQELVSVGALPGIPLDPSGKPYVLHSDGRVVVSNPKRFPFIHEGKPS